MLCRPRYYTVVVVHSSNGPVGHTLVTAPS